MKKLLLLLPLFLFSCSTDNEILPTNQNNQTAVGSLTFTYNGVTKSYNNYNILDFGAIPFQDETKPSLYWSEPSVGDIMLFFELGINETPYKVYLAKSTAFNNTSYEISIKYKNQSTVFCTNEMITIEKIANNRVRGTFTSNEINGSFDQIVNGD